MVITRLRFRLTTGKSAVIKSVFTGEVRRTTKAGAAFAMPAVIAAVV